MKLMELCADESEAGYSRAFLGLSSRLLAWPGRRRARPAGPGGRRGPRAANSERGGPRPGTSIMPATSEPQSCYDRTGLDGTDSESPRPGPRARHRAAGSRASGSAAGPLTVLALRLSHYPWPDHRAPALQHDCGTVSPPAGLRPAGTVSRNNPVKLVNYGKAKVLLSWHVGSRVSKAVLLTTQANPSEPPACSRNLVPSRQYS